MTDSLPPHRLAAVIRAQGEVLRSVQTWLADPAEHERAPTEVIAALRELARIEDEIELWEDARRREHLDAVMHYIAEVGDRFTICGIDTRPRAGTGARPMYGWAGENAAFVLTRLRHGGTVCLDCRRGSGVSNTAARTTTITGVGLDP